MSHEDYVELTGVQCARSGFLSLLIALLLKRRPCNSWQGTTTIGSKALRGP